VILFVLFFFLLLTSLDPPPENGIAIGTTEFGWQRSTDRTHQSAPTAAKQTAASNQDILSGY
jgi:hypothetical protein